MNVQVKIPDEVFNHENSNISRQVLEAVALEGFKAKQMTTAHVSAFWALTRGWKFMNS